MAAFSAIEFPCARARAELPIAREARALDKLLAREWEKEALAVARDGYRLLAVFTAASRASGWTPLGTEAETEAASLASTPSGVVTRTRPVEACSKPSEKSGRFALHQWFLQ